VSNLGWPADYDDDGNVVEASDPMPKEPWTDLGYARRLAHVYGDRLRYVPAWRRWLVWDGRRWAHDTTGQAARWAKVIARRVTTDALAIEDKRDRDAAVKLARRGESSAGVAGALTLAGTETGIVVTPDDMDADPFLLNCANGILDLRTLQLGPHDPTLLLTRLTGAAYRPEAEGPEFARFLERVQPKAEMRDYLARLTGHSLEGRVIEHVLAIFYGPGANGKGTYIAAVLGALGDYADAADPELLTARTFDAHPTGTADLFGLRLAVLHESDHGRRLAEGTVKRLTGGDRVKARRMREDFWHFEPSHTFAMLTNHKPIIGGTDEGIWRRLRLVPWDVIIPPEERDGELGDRLALEHDAVLAFLVRGYADWHRQGLADPPEVRTATDAYRAESDALGRFLGEKCMRHGTVGSSELFAAWSAWCKDEGEEPGTQTAFSAALTNRGFDNYTSNGRRRWRSLGLTCDDVEGSRG
jgi:putative DNA primase/helicase